MRKITLFIVWVFVFMMHPVLGYAQTKDFVIPDSLSGMGYEQLETRFDTNPKEVYARVYLQKARKDRDTPKIVNAYSMLFTLDPKNIMYVDSMLASTQKSKNHAALRGKAYYYKGIYHYLHSEIDLSFIYLNKADSVYTIFKDQMGQVKVNHYKAGIYNELGENRKSLRVLLHNLQILKAHRNVTNYNNIYYNTLNALADSYNRLRIPDSARYYSKIGLYACHFDAANPNYSYFLVSYGVSQFHNKQYQNALDSIQKGMPQYQNANWSLTDIYLIVSDCYSNLHQDQKAIRYLQKIDSIYKVDPSVFSQNLSAHNRLLNLYQKENNLKGQLDALNTILYLDSIKNTSISKTKETILKHNLLTEKQLVLDKLNQKSKNLKLLRYVILGLLVITSLLALMAYQRNKRYKQRFEALINKYDQPELHPTEVEVALDPKEVSEEVMSVIQYRLSVFESQKQYRDQNITLISLSKQFQTNSTYLSKYVNQYLKKSFSQYLSDLRIEDAVLTLKSDPQIRKYTIKAISAYFGFSNPESFSRFFYQKTDIYPSFYIKELNKSEKNT